MSDRKLHAPATLRNRAPILAVLARWLPATGSILEISSGSGEHAVFFAAGLPTLDWQPTDRDSRALDSIAAHCAEADLPNLRPPLMLDAASATWPVTEADAIICINMIHIAPWTACLGLMAGAARVLRAGGMLYLYGPFKEKGVHTADSNHRFDVDLRMRDPDWGVRNIDDVISLADSHGLRHIETTVMPANNRSVVFCRDG